MDDNVEEINTNPQNNDKNNEDDKQELQMIKELNIKAVNLIVKNKYEDALILLKKLEDIFEVIITRKIRLWRLILLKN